MQKRTRIFAAVTVAIGLLLGLAMFASMFLGEAASVGAAPAKKHHNTHTQNRTVTIITTVIQGSTTTVTTTVPVVVPPPGPACHAEPAIVHIGTTAPGQASFTLFCTGLNPNALTTVTSNIVCGTKVWLQDGAVHAEGTLFTVAANGTLSPQFFGQSCAPGTYTVTVTQVIGGQLVSTTTTVTLA